MEDKTILVVVAINNIRQKIKQILENHNYKVIEVSGYSDFQFGLKNKYSHIDMILLDYDVKDSQGNRALSLIKQSGLNKPVLVMSGDHRRSVIIEVIQSGASDIILRPFEEDIIIKKIEKFSQNVEIKSIDNISFNIPELIEKECIKAKKGKYVVTISLSTFLKPVQFVTEALEQEYYKLSGTILKTLHPIFFETDYFIPFGTQSYVGIFPFCDVENYKIISEKMHQSFETLTRENQLMADYHLVNAFITFPTEFDVTKSYDLLLSEITSKLKENITFLKNSQSA